MTNRAYCFTMNNPEGMLDVEFEAWIGNGLRYAIYQLEVGENGTEHFQGYLELDRAQRLSYLQQRLPGAHFEPRRGTREQARDYCKKSEGQLDGPWEFGDFAAGGQGARSDIAGFKAAIDSGCTDKELWDSHPTLFLRNYRAIPMLRSLLQPERSWKTEVWLLYGQPGTGKSTWVKEHCGESVFWKSPNNHWWDKYNGESSVVLDDYKSWLPWSQLLHVMDANPLTMEFKGGMVKFVARKLFITSNFLPWKWYTNPEGDSKYPILALLRRIEHFLCFEPQLDHNPATNTFNVAITEHNNYNDFCAFYGYNE